MKDLLLENFGTSEGILHALHVYPSVCGVFA